jgi:hypothetical protein
MEQYMNQKNIENKQRFFQRIVLAPSNQNKEIEKMFLSIKLVTLAKHRG